MAAPSIHEIILNVVGESDDARRDLGALGAELLALDAVEAEAELKLDDSQFQRERRKVLLELAALSGKSATVDVDLDTDRAERGLRRLTSALSSGGGSSGGSGGLFGMLSNMGGRVLLLIRLLPILIPMIVSLGAAAVAAGASLAGAAAGAGALAIAAGAAATPIAALAAAAITRFAGATEAADKLRAANEQVRNSTEAVADAERTLTDAERQRRFARESLNQAQRDAAQQIADDLRNATQDQASAELDLENAQQQQLAAQDALNDAREQAVRDLQDMRAAARNAALSEKRAEIELERARNRARQFDEGDHSLAAREARLDVKDAEERLREARRDGQRSQEDLNQAEQDGIEGSDAVVAAREQLEQANQRVVDSNIALADANRELARAQRAAQRPAQQVVDARRSLADASRQVDDAERGLARTTHDLEVAQRKQAKAARAAAQSSLGPAGHALQRAARQTLRVFRGATDQGVNRIFRGIADGLELVRPALRALKNEFTGLGGSIGDAFRDWGHELAKPAWVHFWERTTRAAKRIVPDLSDAVRHLAQFFRDVADAAMPFLEDGVDAFKDWTKSLSDASSDADATKDAVAGVVDLLQRWADLVGEGGRALFNIGRGAAPQFNDWLDDMTASLRDFNRWASSPEGKARIREFFDNTVPAARDLLSVIGKLGKAFVKWGELASPALRPLYRILGRILDLLNDILDLLNKLPGPLGDIASGLAAYAGLRAIFGSRGRGAGGIAGAMRAVLSEGKILAGFLAGELLSAMRGLIGLGVRGAIARIGTSFIALAAEGGPIALLIVALVLLVTHWEEVKNAVNDAADAVKGWVGVQKLIDPSPLNDAFEAAKKLARQLGAGAPPAGAEGPIGPGTHGHGGAADKIGKGIADGLKRAASDAAKRAAAELTRPVRPTVGKAGGPAMAGAGGNTFNMPLTVVGGGSPDPVATVAAVSRALRRKGLSLA